MQKPILIAALVLFYASGLAAQDGVSESLTGDQIVELVLPSAVTVLAGRGDGQVAAIGCGLIVRPDGVILTANHVVGGMREVQIRLKNGEIYDRVELIASDERRDAAALRISAVALPVLAISPSANVAPGAPVFVISAGAGLHWTASSGILSATRLADEVPGAGSGFRLLQFTAPMSPESSGGVLVDGQARALGMILGSITSGQNVNFAVPIDSIVGLAAAAGGTPYASGARLQMPGAEQASRPAQPPASTVVPPSLPPDLSLPSPEELPFRTMTVNSKTIYMRRERLQDDLQKTAIFKRLGMRFADYGETADISITVDRPFLTFDWTYAMVFQPNNLTLASGTLEAVDEFEAGPKLAQEIMYQIAAAAMLPPSTMTSSILAPERNGRAPAAPSETGDVLQTCQSIMVESHTIWMKGSLLQDALYVRPEVKEWGIRIVDSRNQADIYIDITRPFLTYDWVYKMIDTGTGSVVGKGKVVAIDGSAAAQRLALEIVGKIRSVRPIPSKEP